MIWLKRHIVAILVALVFAGIIVVSVLLLRQARAQQKDADTRLQTLRQQLDVEMKKKIFPSPKNKEILQGQRRQMEDFFRDVYASLPQREAEYPTMAPWEFKGHVEMQLRKLERLCETNQVMVPKDFSFGFGKFVGDRQPPKKEETPELLHQLDLVDRLLRILFQSRIVALDSVRRTYLDSETDTSHDQRVEGGVWKKDPNLLYQSQNFELTFRCTNDQLKNVLSNLATSTNLLVLVRYISVEVPKVFPTLPMDSATPGAAAGSAPSGGLPPGMNPAYGALGGPGLPATPRGRSAEALGRGRISAQPGANVTGTITDVPLVLGTEIATVHLRLDVIEIKPLAVSDKGKAVSPEPSSQPVGGHAKS